MSEKLHAAVSEWKRQRRADLLFAKLFRPLTPTEAAELAEIHAWLAEEVKRVLPPRVVMLPPPAPRRKD